MPLPAAIIAGSALAGGASLLASSKAAGATQDATDKQIALEQQQYNQTRQDEMPYTQAGYGAVNALTSRLGLNGGPATGAGSQPDYSQYLSANPDLATEAQRVTSDGEFPSVQAYLQWHDANYGSENRPSYVDPAAAQATGQTAGQGPGATAPTPTTVADGSTPASNGAITGTETAAPLGTFGNPNPTYSAPGPFSFTAADYQASPGYQYQVDQALGAVKANAAATGSLQSGATLKALEQRASDLANQDFYNQRNFAAAQYDTDRAFNYQTATGDRNYLTGQYNTNTGNLFNLAGLGQNAASQTAAAGQNSTNGIVNALGNNAATQGNAALAGANAFDSFLNSGVNALAYNNAKNSAAGSTLATNPTAAAQLYGLY